MNYTRALEKLRERLSGPQWRALEVPIALAITRAVLQDFALPSGVACEYLAAAVMGVPA